MESSKRRLIAIVSLLVLILTIGTFSTNMNTVYAANVHKGVALKNPTNVYSDTARNSKVLRSYSEGSILLYTSHSSDWHSAVVFINGVRHNGYIHKTDVETSVENQEVIVGIGVKPSNVVYASASTSSKQLRTYVEGSILYYKTFTSNWYEALVYINGKPTTGYIHKSHVENTVNNQEQLKGIGLKNPTAVYARASTSSNELRTYAAGSILYYKTLSNNWYEALVYINGKATTGYIHKSHVEDIVGQQQSLKGIGLQNPTVVYSKASTSSKQLRTYSSGSILYYKTFSNNWYEALVYINGKATTGYIHASHVEGTFETSDPLNGVSLKSTNVYSRASRNASVLRSYSKGSFLLFRTLSPNWYEATVILNGKATTGYIHRSDVSTDRILSTTTSYNIDYKRVVDIQMGGRPQVSGQNGGWVNASRQQVEYYVNPSNFSRNSTSYFQFLVLSQHASLNANEVNQKILYNHGILTGKAKAFIDAGKKHNVNEAYLISHALLETGNGRSQLASGVPVDNNGNVVDESKKVHTVYNMYGIGAVDSNALRGGAKRAFQEGWFTPEDAIIGGAKFINTYITRGQDTLYKMRWNPSSPGYPQYATDVAWAVKQTTNISRIYSLLDSYVLIYDVPRYVNQPSSSGDPNFYAPVPLRAASLFLFSLPILEEKTDMESVVETIPEVDEEVDVEIIPHANEEADIDGSSNTDNEADTEATESEEVDLNDSEAMDETVESSEEDEIIKSVEEQVYGTNLEEIELRDASNSKDSTVLLTIPEGSKLEINAFDGEWYETIYDGQVGWINGENVSLLNVLEVLIDEANIYLEPIESTNPINIVIKETLLIGVLDENEEIIYENGWYKIYYDGEKAWINGGENGTEYITIK